MPFSAFLLLTAIFMAILGLAGVVTLTRRLDRVERRRVYETECLVKSLQALEQQNLMLAERVQAVTDVRQTISNAISTAARRQANATEEDQQQQGIAAAPASRLLH